MHDYPPLRPMQLVPRCADKETPLLESTRTAEDPHTRPRFRRWGRHQEWRTTKC